jgi:hypothetical protein
MNLNGIVSFVKIVVLFVVKKENHHEHKEGTMVTEYLILHCVHCEYHCELCG